LFCGDADRELWLKTLGEACAKCDWQVHAYSLMTNHFHLVVETPRANLEANRGRSLRLTGYSTINFEYDDAGLVKKEKNSIAGSGGEVPTTYERYPNGSVSRIVYPENSSIRRDYNSRGQLSATGSSNASNNWSVQHATYHYLGDGKLDYQDYVNGVHTAFGYDPRGFLNHLTVTRSGQTYAERTYYRDDRDRISAFQKGSNSSANPMEDGRGDHYWYDPEGQLTDAYYGAIDPVNNPHGPIRSDSFAYDALGNGRGGIMWQTRGG
jgi:hypothetical protein